MRYIILLAIFLLSGCATPYQSKGINGGFSETRISENIFQVNFAGNGSTGLERSSDFALLRCAELTLESGYRYFILLNNKNAVSTSTYTTPMQAHTTGYTNTYGTVNTYPTYGNGSRSRYSGSSYGQSTTYFTGGQVYNINRPKSSNTIMMFHEKPERGLILDAAFLEKTLRAKYNLKG